MSRDDVLVFGFNKDVLFLIFLLFGGDIFDVLEEIVILKIIEMKESLVVEDVFFLFVILFVVNEDFRFVFGIFILDLVKSGNMLGDRGLVCDL